MDKKALEPLLFPSWADFPDIELYMDQVISVLEKHLIPYFPEDKCITSTMINNYVKQKLIPSPQNKRYTKGQITKLYIICILKSFMQLSDIGNLLEYLGKDRTEEELYRLFSRHLETAVYSITQGESAPTPKDTGENALLAALRAFVSILVAKSVYRNASKKWNVRPAEEKAEKEPKKEKKEKKKA